MKRLFLLAIPLLLTAQTRDRLPVPDVGRYHTLKCDFHMHTVFSDGDVWPTTRVTEAWRDGLDAIAITDHNHYNPKKEDVKPDINRPYAIARPLAAQLGIILIPAMEFAEGNLHANALFVNNANAFFGLNLVQAYAEAQKQNAFVFWNHPGWKETPQWYPPIAAAHAAKQLHGMELVNGLTFYPDAYPWIEEHQLTILANSDIHSTIDLNYGRRERPVTLVFAEQAAPAGVRAALEARRTAAWMGGEVWGSEELLRGLWTGAVKVTAPAAAGRRAGIILENTSALPFKLKLKQAPEGLSVRATEVPPEKTAGLVVTAAAAVPVGKLAGQIELEVTNFHTGPGRNLVVSVPVTLDVK